VSSSLARRRRRRRRSLASLHPDAPRTHPSSPPPNQSQNNSVVNSIMMHGRNNGKKLMAVRIVSHAFDIVHLLTDQNPVQVLVDAIINSGPREDATRIGSAGVVRRQAVDISPLRRVNQAIWLLCTGAREAAFRNVKTIAECLADELINAAKGSSNSYAIKKKDELERVAKANR
jgi:small subunit ribosomal protein S5e